MAADTRRKYYSTVYASDYDGNAARKLERQELQRPRPVRSPRHAVRRRPKVRTREAGRIAVFSVVGMLALGLFAVVVLFNYAQLMVANDSAVQLRSQLQSLQEQEAKLLAQYELTYDLQSIENQALASGQMVKPSSSQIYTLELDAEDSVEYYQDVGQKTGTEPADATEQTEENSALSADDSANQPATDVTAAAENQS